MQRFYTSKQDVTFCSHVSSSVFMNNKSIPGCCQEMKLCRINSGCFLPCIDLSVSADCKCKAILRQYAAARECAFICYYVFYLSFIAPKTSAIIQCSSVLRVCVSLCVCLFTVTSFPPTGIIHPVKWWGGKCHYVEIADMQLDLQGIGCVSECAWVCVREGDREQRGSIRARDSKVHFVTLFNPLGAVIN